MYTRDSSRVWKQAGTTGPELTLKEASANNLIEAYMGEGRHQNIVDFDDHLDDITKSVPLYPFNLFNTTLDHGIKYVLWIRYSVSCNQRCFLIEDNITYLGTFSDFR